MSWQRRALVPDPQRRDAGRLQWSILLLKLSHFKSGTAVISPEKRGFQAHSARAAAPASWGGSIACVPACVRARRGPLSSDIERRPERGCRFFRANLSQIPRNVGRGRNRATRPACRTTEHRVHAGLPARSGWPDRAGPCLPRNRARRDRKSPDRRPLAYGHGRYAGQGLGHGFRHCAGVAGKRGIGKQDSHEASVSPPPTLSRAFGMRSPRVVNKSGESTR